MYTVADLIDAIEAKSVEKVKEILASKTVDINGVRGGASGKVSQTPLMAAWALKDPAAREQMVEQLVQAGVTVTDSDLYYVIKKGDVKTAKRLIAAGGKVDTKDTHALIRSAERGKYEAVSLLLSLGMDINKPMRGNNKATALHAVFPNSNVCVFTNETDRNKTFYTLLAAGANVNAQDVNGNTPLHLAMIYDKKYAKTLLAQGSDINALNKNKQTPLGYAFGKIYFDYGNAHRHPAFFLLNHGADPLKGKVDIFNNDERSPLELLGFKNFFGTCSLAANLRKNDKGEYVLSNAMQALLDQGSLTDTDKAKLFEDAKTIRRLIAEKGTSYPVLAHLQASGLSLTETENTLSQLNRKTSGAPTKADESLLDTLLIKRKEKTQPFDDIPIVIALAACLQNNGTLTESAAKMYEQHLPKTHSLHQENLTNAKKIQQIVEQYGQSYTTILDLHTQDFSLAQIEKLARRRDPMMRAFGKAAGIPPDIAPSITQYLSPHDRAAIASVCSATAIAADPLWIQRSPASGWRALASLCSQSAGQGIPPEMVCHIDRFLNPKERIAVKQLNHATATAADPTWRQRFEASKQAASAHERQ